MYPYFLAILCYAVAIIEGVNGRFDNAYPTALTGIICMAIATKEK